MSIKWPIVLLLLLVPIGLIMYQKFRKKHMKPVFVAESEVLKLLPSYRKHTKRSRRLRRVEIVFICLLLLMSLLVVARPQKIITSYNEQKSRDTVLCLDVSGSMTEYVGIALDTLQRVYKENPNDRYGIVVFGSRSFTVLPLTRDQVAIQQKIDMLREVYVKENDPNYQFRDLPGFGTDVGEGMLASVQRFDDLKTYKTRNIILVSDLDQTGGDYDPESKHYLEKAELIPKNRINLFVLQPAPAYDFATGPSQIIAVTGGSVYKVDKNNSQESAKNLVNQIFQQILNTRLVTGTNEADYPYLMLLAFAVLMSLWTVIVWLRWRYV